MATVGVLFESVAFASDVQHMAVVKQPAQDCRGNDGVAESFAHSLNPMFEEGSDLPANHGPILLNPSRFQAGTMFVKAMA